MFLLSTLLFGCNEEEITRFEELEYDNLPPIDNGIVFGPRAFDQYLWIFPIIIDRFHDIARLFYLSVGLVGGLVIFKLNFKSFSHK